METQEQGLAVVTGASSGIGYELAKVFAEHGYDLLICAEDAGIAEAAQGIGAGGAKVEYLRADLATPEGPEQLWQKAISLGRPIDAVVINAGIGVNGDFARETDLAQELKLVDLNVRSVVHLAKLCSRYFVERGQGRILITSSIAGTMPATFTAVYGASKAFDLSFAEALRAELKETGVTVTALLPGPTETNFFTRANMEDTKVGQAKKDDPGDVARDGFAALMAGDDKVVAGAFKNKAQVYLGRIIPDAVKAKLHKSEAGPAGEKK